MNEIRTRFAPSPTGLLHIGSLRTALYSYAFAKSRGGKFLLRIEDTDRDRFVPGSVEKIYEMLEKFGLIWDEGPTKSGPYEPYVQSERVSLGVYKSVAETMIEKDQAFYCQCEARNAKAQGYSKILRDPCREKKLTSGAIKLKVPDNIPISYHDFILEKDVTWDSSTIGDTTLLKSDGFPTYHLAAMVDDMQMKISHILRGHDWLPSTPVHILIFKFLGYMPQIGHLTDILDPEGGKLSKRKGSVTVEAMLAEGYLPEAILNFVMLLGWAPKDNQEIFSLAEFVDNFQKGSLQIANPVFNRKKLDWFNGYYIRQKTDEELAVLFHPFLSPPNPSYPSNPSGTLEKAIPLVKDRIVKLSDFNLLAGFFFERPKIDITLFGDLPYKEHLNGAISNLTNLTNWTNEAIQASLTSLVSQNGWKTGDFYMSLRLALTASRFTPPITESAVILGKEETLSRLSAIPF